MKNHIPTAFQGRRKPNSKQINRMRAKIEERTNSSL
jgi:hypothetical protein